MGVKWTGAREDYWRAMQAARLERDYEADAAMRETDAELHEDMERDERAWER